MSSARILFVDDEPTVLQGLRDSLRRRRRVWDMVFANGGAEALERLKDGEFDVIVSDMRMPGMDGASLLETVRTQYPDISRIVLSGHSEQDQMLRASKVAHQFLSKPCDRQVLQNTLEQMIAARELAGRREVREMVGRISSLPAVGSIHRELMAASGSENCRMDAIASILERDSGLMIRVLQMANSAFHGRLTELNTAVDAIEVLGLDQIRALVISAQLFQELERSCAIEHFDVRAWQVHSLISGRLASLLCMDPSVSDQAFVAGLLHDIGTVVFVLCRPDDFAELLRSKTQNGSDRVDLERQLMGFCHDEVGAYLLAVWGICPSIANAVRKHHCAAGGVVFDQPLTECDAVAYAVWAANEVHHRFGQSLDGVQLQHWLDQQKAAIDLPQNRIEELLHAMQVDQTEPVAIGASDIRSKVNS